MWPGRLLSRFQALPPDWWRWSVTGLFILAQAFIWIVVLEILWYGDRSITDTPVYYDYASRVAGGMFPYRDFASEYPPVAMLLFSLPRLFSGAGYGSFVVWFEAEMLAFSCGIVILVSMLAFRQWRSVAKMAAALGLYTFFILAMGSIVKSRFDLAAAFLILAALACFIIDRKLFAWLLIGVGLMTKIVPVLVAPLFLIAHFRRREYSHMWLGPLAAGMAAMIIALPFLIASPSGLAGSFLYHAERPLQLESSWASPLLILFRFGGMDLSIMNSYGSHNVFSPAAELLALLSGPATAALLLVGYLIFYRGTEKDFNDPVYQGRLIRFSALAIATFIVGGKVLSPQFLIWLLPLVPLVTGRDRRMVAGLFTAVLLLTQWEFPARYWNLYMLETDMIILVALRNLLLAVLVTALAIGGRRSRAREEFSLATATARSR